MRNGIIRVGLIILFLLFFIAPKQVQASELEKPEISYPSDGNEYQLDNMKVDWQDCYNVDYYLISIRDLTNDNSILNRSKVYSSYYNISKSKFTYGHEYRIAVASVDNGVEEWSEVEFKIANLEIEEPAISYPLSNSEYEIRDMTVDWQNCANAIKYTLSLRDITNDTLIIDHKYTSSSSYTIDDSYFTAGHSYRLAVASVNGDTEEWSEIEFKIKSTPSPIMTNFGLSNTSITLGDTVFFSGTIDSNGGTLEKVTVNIQGPNDESNAVTYMTRTISGTSYNMSNISSFVAGKTFMTSAGQYWVEVWAKNKNGEGVLVAEQTVTVITTPPPTMTNFALNKTSITLGDTVTFSGTLNGNGGTLEKVTINIQGPDSETNSVEYTSRSINGTSYNMSSISSFVAGKTYMPKAGQYWVEVWAKNKNGEGVLVSEQIVTVITTPPPTMTDFTLSKTTITIGDTVKFCGTLSGNGGTLEKVTINIQGPENETNSVEYTSKTISGTSYNMSNISSFMAGKTYMISAGKYWVEVWAKNKNGEGVLVSEQTVTVITTPPPTMTNFALNKTTITLGDTVKFSGTLNGNGGTLEKVTINIQGPDSETNSVEYTSRSINGTSYNMSNIPSLVAGKNYMLKAGQYCVKVWAKNKNGEGVLVAEQTVTVITTPPPTMTDFTLSKTTITLGDTVKFSGTLNGNGGTLEKVTINIQGPDSETNSVEYTSRSINGTSYNMSNIPSLVAGKNYMLKAGQYRVKVWAKNKNGEGVLVAEQTVTVITTPSPTMTDFALNNTTIVIGDTVSFKGTIKSNGGSLEKITINIQGPNDEKKAVTYVTKSISGTNYNMSNISSFVAGKTYMATAGTYWIEVWVKNKNSEGVLVAEKTVTVLAASEPTITDFSLSNTSISLGETISFRGTINSNGGSLEKVTVNIQGPDNETIAVTYTTQSISGTSYNMSNIPTFVAGKKYMAKPGKYWVEVWVKNKNGKGMMVDEQVVTVTQYVCVSGIILNKYNLSEIDNVNIEFSGLTYTTITDGKFNFPKVMISTHNLTAKKAGYFLVDEKGKQQEYIQLNVSNIGLNNSKIYMIKDTGYQITGYVKDANGKAIEGAKVIPFGTDSTVERFAVYTDNSGKFTMLGVDQGWHKLIVTKDGYVSNQDIYDIQIPSTQPIEIIMSNLVMVEGTICEGYFLGGTNDKAILNAKVWLNDGGTKWTVNPPIKKGYYQILGVKPDWHTLHVEASGYSTVNTLESSYRKDIYVDPNNQTFNVLLVKNENIPSKEYRQVVKDAYNYGLLSKDTIAGFKSKITRSEYVDLIKKLFTKIGGRSEDIPRIKNFNIYKNDNSTISRQDAGIMLYNAIALAIPGVTSAKSNNPYSDLKAIDNEAINAISYLYQKNIMIGEGGKLFSPQKFITKEQAIKVIFNAYTSKDIITKEANEIVLDQNDWKISKKDLVPITIDNKRYYLQTIGNEVCALFNSDYNIVKDRNIIEKASLVSFFISRKTYMIDECKALKNTMVEYQKSILGYMATHKIANIAGESLLYTSVGFPPSVSIKEAISNQISLTNPDYESIIILLCMYDIKQQTDVISQGIELFNSDNRFDYNKLNDWYIDFISMLQLFPKYDGFLRNDLLNIRTGIVGAIQTSAEWVLVEGMYEGVIVKNVDKVFSKALINNDTKMLTNVVIAVGSPIMAEQFAKLAGKAGNYLPKLYEIYDLKYQLDTVTDYSFFNVYLSNSQYNYYLGNIERCRLY